MQNGTSSYDLTLNTAVFAGNYCQCSISPTLVAGAILFQVSPPRLGFPSGTAAEQIVKSTPDQRSSSTRNYAASYFVRYGLRIHVSPSTECKHGLGQNVVALTTCSFVYNYDAITNVTKGTAPIAFPLKEAGGDHHASSMGYGNQSQTWLVGENSMARVMSQAGSREYLAIVPCNLQAH